MKLSSIKRTDYRRSKEGAPLKLSKVKFESFGPDILGLGDLKMESIATDAIAAIFDLEGFTKFCTQIEPRLSIPRFLSKFLDWMFIRIKDEMRERTQEDETVLWSPLPFFIKFLGDGLLVLWDVSGSNDNHKLNIIISCYNICKDYKKEFYPTLKRMVSAAPMTLRCGVARGDVFSVGNGEDYVGSCINMATRLQKLNGATFAFNLRGFDIESAAKFSEDDSQSLHKLTVIKRVAIRGIGDEELIGMMKYEFDRLSPEDKANFESVDD